MPVSLIQLLEQQSPHFFPVIPALEQSKAAPLNLSATNKRFSESIYSNLEAFNGFIRQTLLESGVEFLFGGYGENRQMYRRSALFDKNLSESSSTEPRSLHLGLDIWGPAGTEIRAPLGGMLHSQAFHNRVGDYGGTIILSHQLEGVSFYCLYGHLAETDLHRYRDGQFINRGEIIGYFGEPTENGHWPPHLHFQLIADIGVHEGDYPGVCKPSESQHYLVNSPDPAPFFPVLKKYR